MIQVSGSVTDFSALSSPYPPGSIESNILRILSASPETYTYAQLSQLTFELDLRKKIVNASRELHRSRFSFETFRESRCNPEYWERTDEGGFLLKPGKSSAAAIQDIYRNSRLYGTECSTAIVIVFYKALTDIFPVELFHSLFPRPYLMNWTHLDNDLGINTYRNVADYLPGDCLYFKNPEVDPATPEWQGENVIDLGNGTYYGHGIGITTAGEFIAALNEHRISGATVSAFLMDSATRPDFQSLGQKLAYFSSGT